MKKIRKDHLQSGFRKYNVDVVTQCRVSIHSKAVLSMSLNRKIRKFDNAKICFGRTLLSYFNCSRFVLHYVVQFELNTTKLHHII